MPNGWSPNEYKVGAIVTLGASVSNTPVSREFPIYSGGALNLVVAIDTSTTTVGAGITAKLQTAIGDGWEDSKTVAVTTDDRYYIKLQTTATADQTFLPLLSKGRVVVTTGAGSAVTIDAVYVLQEL